MGRDLGDNENIIEDITANSDCCVDIGNGCDIAKDKREEAVTTSLFLIANPIANYPANHNSNLLLP